MKRKLLPAMNILLSASLLSTFGFASDKPNSTLDIPAETGSSSASGFKHIHQSLLTLDTHVDVPITLGLYDAKPSVFSPMQVDIPSMKQGGLDAAFFIVYVAQGPVSDTGYKIAYQAALAKFTAIERMLANNPDTIELVTSPKALRRASARGKVAAAIGVENAFSLGPNFEHLEEFYERGARYISLTHFGNNHFGDSSVAKGPQSGVTEPVHGGLSALGRELITKMNTFGIMVDVSHTSKQSTLDAVRHSKTPVIASHSGVKALYDHPRNLSDDEILAIAKSGGVVQLVAFDRYMRPVSLEEKAAIEELKKTLGLDTPDWYKTATQTDIDKFRRASAALNERFPRTTVSDFVDHIEYVVKLVGIDHAGVSSDFGGGGGVRGWDYIIDTPVVTLELLERGFTAQQIEKIWSGNFLRVWQEVDDYAASISKQNT